MPLVYIEGAGYADNTSTNAILNYPFRLDNLSQSTGYIYGGETVSIYGIGVNLEPSKIWVKMCDQYVDVVLVNNI